SILDGGLMQDYQAAPPVSSGSAVPSIPGQAPATDVPQAPGAGAVPSAPAEVPQAPAAPADSSAAVPSAPAGSEVPAQNSDGSSGAPAGQSAHLSWQAALF